MPPNTRKKPLNPRRLLMRVSELSRIPYRAIKPRVGKGKRNALLEGGYYNPLEHSFTYAHRDRAFRRHELTHAAQFILAPPHIIENFGNRKWRRNMIRFMEATNPGADRFQSVVNILVGTNIFGFPDILSDYSARRIFHTYGVDGLILLYVNPPLDKKGFYTHKIKQWEKSMLEKGYFSPDGKVAEKGIIFLETKVKKAVRSKFRKVKRK